MVGSGSEILSQGVVDSPLPQDQQPRNNAFSSLGRQSSIYSLTLDEFQHSLCDGSKNFGSMNMDEFLNSIWTAEENQAVDNNGNQNSIPKSSDNNEVNLSLGEASSHKPLSKQTSLPHQGALMLPLPLCRKTVDEVWSKIHKTQQQEKQKTSSTTQNATSASRQTTFGEMTLEDFLVKAGVVREQIPAPVPAPPPQQLYGLYQNNNHPSMGVVASVGMTYPTMPHVGDGVMEPPVYGKRNSGYHAPPACYSGRMGNGGRYGQPRAMGVDTSLVSPDGIGTSQGDSEVNQYEMDISGSRGRKRIADVPGEKVVERRQRRMVKNRESAARSRSRKQAYTVELEAEMNQLRDENAQLKETLAELERKRKQQYFEEIKMRAQMRAQKAKERLRVMRRTLSGPL